MRDLVGLETPAYRDFLRRRKRGAYLAGRRGRELEGEAAANPYMISATGNSHLMDAWALGYREGGSPEPDESVEAMRG